MIKSIVEFLFPYRCPFCKDVIEYKAKVCIPCMDKLSLIKDYDIKKHLYKTEYIDNIYSCFFYEGDVKSAIINFKGYNNNKMKSFKQDAIVFSEILLYINDKIILNNIYDMVSCIPSSHSENHSMILSKELASILGVEFKNLLKKVKENEKQHLLNFKDRIENIKDVFCLIEEDKSFLRGKNILLVDDVITTGATANECCKILKSFGADRVDLCTIAVTKFTRG